MKRVFLSSMLACSLILIFVIVTAADFYVIPVNKPASRLVGEIIMWSGEMDVTGKHPTINGKADHRWRICDGGDGTPNLIERFIWGARTAVPPAIGGASTTVLSEDNMPPHYHTIIDKTDCSSHRHVYPDKYHAVGSYTILPGFTALARGEIDTPRYTLSEDQGSNDPQAGCEQGHAHNIWLNTEMKGGGSAIDIIPPYYSLVFLMYMGN